ncbi:MAG: ribonuclease P protein component 2 [Candidatus Diapherotrites archaeon]|nr:ribonuclease P protein component 2 [Candidatus Diapherotrites archaeon]
MKPFPPTLREKRRYIEFKVHGPTTEKDVSQAISNSVLSLFGEDGYARANFSIIEYEKGVGICRCTHEWLDNILIALAFVGQIKGEKARITVLSVSGTLKTIRKAKGI